MAQSFTTQNLTSTSGLSAKMAIYYDKRMLSRLRPKLVFHNFGEEKTLPKNSGVTVKWFRRTDRSANTTPITEGTTPSPVQMAASQKTATLAQYGDWTQTSDLIEMTSIDDEIAHAVDVLSFQAARTIDALDRNLLDADTTNQMVGDGTAFTAVASVTAAMKLNGAGIRNGVRLLKAANAEAFDGGYSLIVHPNNSYDLFGDAATGGWQQMNTYVNVENPQKGVVGKYFGAQVIETTELTNATDGASSAHVYRCHLIGQGALGVVNFDGGTHVIAKKPDGSDTSNPLNLYGTVGYKLAYANVILDGARQVTMFTGSSY